MGRGYGDWSGHKQAIVSLVERKSGYILLAKVPNKIANLVGNAIINFITPIRDWVSTITYDNGKEFSNHKIIDKALNLTSYFSDPFSSWQRNCNENLNGLLRQYIPKNVRYLLLHQMK